MDEGPIPSIEAAAEAQVVLRPAAPRILIVEPDTEIRDLLKTALALEGCEVQSTPSLKDAQALLRQQLFRLVLSDSFARSQQEALAYLAALRQEVAPVPVGILTGWALTPSEVEEQGFAFLLRKPFDLNELLGRVAEALALPLDPEQHPHARLVVRVLDATNRRDFSEYAQLCAQDVQAYSWVASQADQPIVGVDALLAYIEKYLERLPHSSYTQYLLYPVPDGIAARFIWQSENAAGGRQQVAISYRYAIAGDKIAQIGTQEDIQQLWRLSGLEPAGNAPE